MKEEVLGEIAEVKTGPFGSNLKNEQYIVGGTPVITVEHIKDFTVENFNYPSVTEEDKNRLSAYLVKEGDILFTRVGSVDLSAYIDANQDGWLFSSRMLRVRPQSKIDSRFLSYYFQQKNFRDHILNISVGATMPSINTEILKSILIKYPPLSKQKAIASVLSVLDDKIDLLRRQNETLEAMAEALFKEWFVVNAKEDWEEVKLENYVACFNGVSYKSTDLNPSETALVTLKNFDRSGGMRLDGFKEYAGKYKEQHVVEEGDLVVAHTDITQDAALIGNPIYIVSDPKYKNLVISMDLVKVKTKFEWLSLEFLYLLMRSSEFKEHCLGYSNGSTVLHLSKSAIPSFTLRLPPHSVVIEFTTLVKPLLRKKLQNIQQTRTLTKLRDTLLPKLMSGEVRVN